MKIFTAFKKHWIFSLSLVFVFAAVFAILASQSQNSGKSEANEQLSAKLIPVSEYGQKNLVDLGTGTVESLAQADLKAQYTAPVAAIKAKLGDNVSAGQILVVLKNDDIAAQLKQAQANLDAALSRLEETKRGARAEDLAIAKTSVLQAQSAAQNAAISAYSAADDAVRNRVDKFFSNPRSENARFGITIISGTNYAVFAGGDQFAQSEINQKKYEIEKMLAGWEKNIALAADPETISRNLETAKTNTSRLIEFLNQMSLLVNQMSASDAAYKITLDGYKTDFYAARSAVSASQQALLAAQTNMEVAQKTLALKEAGSSDEQISQAEAAAKLAQAAVDLAQAGFEKTIVRSPISGKISYISARLGEMTMSGQLVASVVNTEILLVKVYGAQEDMPYVFQNSRAIINGNAKGFVQAVSPSVNPQTRKFQADIIIADNPNGAIVAGQTAAVEVLAENKKDETTYLLPIEAILFSADGNFVLTANKEGVIEQIPVTIGKLIGEKAQITQGLASDLKIIDSVRGFKAGDIIKIQEQE